MIVSGGELRQVVIKVGIKASGNKSSNKASGNNKVSQLGAYVLLITYRQKYIVNYFIIELIEKKRRIIRGRKLMLALRKNTAIIIQRNDLTIEFEKTGVE